MIRDEGLQPLEDDVAGRAGLEALGVVQAEESVRMPVVHQTLRDRLADAGPGDIATEDRVHEGGLAGPRLAEHREVEGAEGRECLREPLLEHPLEVGTAQVVSGCRSSGLDGHFPTVRVRAVRCRQPPRVTVEPCRNEGRNRCA